MIQIIFGIVGGLAAVIYTDAAQSVIMVIGAVILMCFSIYEVGGWEDLKMKYALSVPANTTMGKHS